VTSSINRKYITCYNAPRAGSSHGRRQRAQKFGEIWTNDSRDMEMELSKLGKVRNLRLLLSGSG